ncbi:MAG: flagellar basal body L-ring protein FlgH [Alphaproteobacteria bacterium]|nr:flagellar basal body L-ring protein FlgH [Alphaproteobacteria bacterium]
MESSKFFLKMTVIVSVITLSGCNALRRISEIGEPPKLSKIENPVEKHDYKPVSMPMPTAHPVNVSSNSLWRHGARGFFKDQRASRVGDILTVKVTIADKALLKNKSEQTREDKDEADITAFLGLQENLKDILPEAVDPTNLLDTETSREISGDGSIDRNETIDITVAAIITQILPNGNLVVAGRQEVRVNYELRQLLVTGIVRREDISSANTVESDKIAELRVSYGGKGTISDVQQPRYGRQLLDVVMPF